MAVAPTREAWEAERQRIAARYDLERFWADLDPEERLLKLELIRVAPDAQGHGAGTSAMRDTIAWADRHGVTIVLTPKSDRGTKTRLTRWYRSLGFVPNKGRSKDFRTRQTMLRLPNPDDADLSYLLGPRSSLPQVGAEQGKTPRNGIALYRSAHHSFRYVWIDHGVPFAALQIVEVSPRRGVVANVFTRADVRRRGLASALLGRAAQDFDTIEHAIHLTREGAAFKRASERRLAVPGRSSNLASDVVAGMRSGPAPSERANETIRLLREQNTEARSRRAREAWERAMRNARRLADGEA